MPHNPSQRLHKASALPPKRLAELADVTVTEVPDEHDPAPTPTEAKGARVSGRAAALNRGVG